MGWLIEHVVCQLQERHDMGRGGVHRVGVLDGDLK
jgi:hypothetical protein